MTQWWKPDLYMRKRHFVQDRARIVSNVRRFFDARGYLEVETPALQTAPCMEPHIKAFATDLLSADQQSIRKMYLHTSPEFAMKKLLVAGLPKIYQLAKVFRNAEGSSFHTPEFTMLEWYQTGMDYCDMIDETIDLVRYVISDTTSAKAEVWPQNDMASPCARSRSSPRWCENEKSFLSWKNKTSDPHADWEILTVCQAMTKYAGLDLESVLDDFEAFAKASAAIGIPAHAGDRWDDLFFRVFLEKVEPNIGSPVPTVICDYPVSMAALARPKPDDPRFAERFEVYVCGMELCNAFGELTDAPSQRARFHHDVKLRKQIYGEDYPVDEDFLSAIDHGLPQSSGNALGIDRLVMLILGATDIRDVQACGI